MASPGSTSEELSAEKLKEYDSDLSRKGDKNLPLYWSKLDGTHIRVRVGPNYKKNKQKEVSAESLYECVGIELYKDEEKDEIIKNYAARMKLPEVRPEDDMEAIEKAGLVRLILINVQLPYAKVSMYSGKTALEHGCSLIFIFAVKPETVQEALSESPRPAVSLLKRFIDEWDTNEDIRRRFKALATCDNLGSLGLKGASFYKRFNGKPVIINKSGEINREGAEYLELEVKVREFKFATLKGIDVFRESLKDMFLNGAFVIQAEDDSELPEILFGAVSLRNLSLTSAKQIVVDE